MDAMGARGVDGAGNVKVKLCTVEAGCSVDAMISTSRVNESCKRSFNCAPGAMSNSHYDAPSTPWRASFQPPACSGAQSY